MNRRQKKFIKSAGTEQNLDSKISMKPLMALVVTFASTKSKVVD